MIKKVLIALLSSIMTVSLAFADGVYMDDLSEEDKSLSITYMYGPEAIEGATIDIYKFADMDVHNGNVTYTLSKDFESVSTELTEMNQKESIDIAKKLDVKNIKKYSSKVTDKEGSVKFEKLDPGMYLVVQSGSSGVALDYENFANYIVNVPLAEDGSWVDEVICFPKTTTSKKPKAPPTGDNTSILILGGVGILALAGCILLSKKSK